MLSLISILQWYMKLVKFSIRIKSLMMQILMLQFIIQLSWYARRIICYVLIHCLVNPVYVYSLVFWCFFFCELYNIYIKYFLHVYALHLHTCIMTKSCIYNFISLINRFLFILDALVDYCGKIWWKKMIIIEIVYLAISLILCSMKYIFTCKWIEPAPL